MFGGTFAPRGWALCDGQLLAVSQNDALFSLLGTIYGGDGRTTFGLPDLQGRAPMHMGQGPGLTNRRLGSKFGTEMETVIVNELPAHSHSVSIGTATGNAADTAVPTGNSLALANIYSTETAPSNVVELIGAVTASGSTSSTGGSQPHGNMSPYLTINFIIALVGIYPSRT